MPWWERIWDLALAQVACGLFMLSLRVTNFPFQVSLESMYFFFFLPLGYAALHSLELVNYLE